MGGKTSTSSSQVSIPPEVLARYNSVNANAEKVAKTPFQPYSNDPNAFVAPLNQQQIAGMQNINQSAGAAQPYYGAATRMTAAGAAPTNIGNVSGQDIGQYMNPYVQGVVNPAAQLLNQQQQAQMSGQTGQAMQQGAFGGDRSNLAAANLAGQQGLAFSNAINPLFSQGYTQALGAAQQQQGFQLGQQQQNLARMGQAGQQLAGIGTAAQGAGLQGAQAQMAAGQIGQQTEQAGKSALYNQFQQQQSYPFQTAQFLANIAEGTGALSGSTTTTTQPQSFFSDERVKEGVEDIGRTHDGQKIVKFRYKGEKGPKQIGLIAQDVEKHHPDAVGEYHGIKTVDYDKATKDAASMGGAVEPQHAGLGFAGGGLVGADDWNKLRAAQQQMWAGNGQPMTGGMPHGGKGLNFPAPGHVGSLVVAKTPSEKPKTGVQQVAGGLSDAAKGVTDATNIKKGYDAAKEAWDGDTSGGDKGTAAQAIAAPAADVDPEDIAQGLMARGGYIHRADGGDTDAPEDLYPAPGGLTIPDDNPHAKLEPAKPPSASGSGSSDAAGAMQAAAAAAKIAMMFMARGGSVEDREHHYSGGLVNGRHHFDGSDGSTVIDDSIPIDDGSQYADQSIILPKDSPARVLSLAKEASAKRENNDTPQLQAAFDAFMPQKPNMGMGERREFTPAPVGGLEPTASGRAESPAAVADMPDAGLVPVSATPTSTVTTSKPIKNLNADAGLPATGVMTTTPAGLVPAKTTAEAPVAATAAAPAAGAGYDRSAASPQDLTLNLIGKREGFRQNAYWDTNHFRTGFGSDTVTLPDGTYRTVTKDTRVTAEEAQRDLLRRAALSQGQVQKAIGSDAWNSLTPQAQAALTSLTYNYGRVPPSVAAAGRSGDPKAIADAVAGLQNANNGVNRDRRLEEASLIDPSRSYTSKQGGLGNQYALARQALAKATESGDQSAISKAAADMAALQGSGGQDRGQQEGGDTGVMSGLGKVASDVGDWYGRNEKWLSPVMQGLAAMASSNSRYLGSAMLQGLGAGAQASTNLEQKQAQIAQTKAATSGTQAQTAGTNIENFKKSFKETPYGNVVFLANGLPILQSEYIKRLNSGEKLQTLGALPPDADARVERAFAGNPEVTAAATTGVAPAAGASPVPGAPPVPGATPAAGTAPAVGATPSNGVGYDGASRTRAEAEQAVALNGGVQGANAMARTKAYNESTTVDAASARKNAPLYSTLANTISNAVNTRGWEQPGFGASVRGQFVSAANTIVSALGGQPVGTLAPNIDVINKITSVLGQQTAQSGNQDSYAALAAIQKALPNLDIDPQAAVKLTAELMTIKQRSLDREAHMLQYGKDSGGLMSEAALDFDRLNPEGKYKKEEEILRHIIAKRPKAMKELSSGTLPPNYIQETLSKPKWYGAGTPPGMYRYFVHRGV